MRSTESLVRRNNAKPLAMVSAALALAFVSPSSAEISVVQAQILSGDLVVSGHAPAGGATIFMVGTEYSVTADERGYFTFRLPHLPTDCLLTLEAAGESREVVVSGCRPFEAPRIAEVTVCAEFNFNLPGALFQSAFRLNAFGFRAGVGTDPLAAVDFGDEIGLEVGEAGVVIEPPVPASEIRVRIGTDDRPIEIVAHGVDGDVQARTTVPAHRGYATVTLIGDNISSVAVGGGVIRQACIEANVVAR